MPTYILDAVDSLEPLAMLVKFLPKFQGGGFKHPKHPPSYHPAG